LTGDMEPDQKHFQKVLEMEAPEELRGLARDGLREIASRELKAKGPRMDAVFYLLDALRLFRGKSIDEVREITFEIGMLGQHGLDINDHRNVSQDNYFNNKDFNGPPIDHFNQALKQIQARAI